MDQTTLVSGSSSGFGRLIVETLARRGYTVFAGMRAVAGKNAPAVDGLRDELAPFGVDAAIVEPGTYPTPISAHQVSAADAARAGPYREAVEAFDTQFFAHIRSSTPPNPQEVADAVAPLIGERAGQRPLHTVVAPPRNAELPKP